MAYTIKEEKVVKEFLDGVKLIKKKFPETKVKARKVHGNSFVSGEPDVLMCYNGRMIQIEFKSPDARGKDAEPTPKQSKSLKGWAEAGAISFYTCDADEAMRLCGLAPLWRQVKPKKRIRKEVKVDVESF